MQPALIKILINGRSSSVVESVAFSMIKKSKYSCNDININEKDLKNNSKSHNGVGKWF